MFKVNTYFDGKVMSMGFENNEGKLTMGVMAAGEYEFGTSTIEHMTVTSGKMKVLLPGETAWQEFGPYETFMVAKDAKFKVVTELPTAYKCLYL